MKEEEDSEQGEGGLAGEEVEVGGGREKAEREQEEGNVRGCLDSTSCAGIMQRRDVSSRSAVSPGLPRGCISVAAVLGIRRRRQA